MTSTPYRSGYRVEHTIRALTPDEEAMVRERQEQWSAGLAPQEPHPLLGVGSVLAGCLGVAVFAALRGDMRMLALAVVTAPFAIAFAATGARKRREHEAKSRGPWHDPKGGWTVRATHIVARSVVGTVSAAVEDGHWVLFEVPGGDWFFIDPYELPEPRPDLARAHVHLTRLWPDGPYLSAETSREPIPLHGASDGLVVGDDFVAALERGWVWRPWAEEGEDAEADHEPAPRVVNLDTQLVPESELPEWIRNAVKRP